MSINAKILADSLSTSGHRLTTMLIRFPRYILPEINTHRICAKNTASSRAIPIATLSRRIREDPANIVFWGRHQAGMQADVELTGLRRWLVKRVWASARWFGVSHARMLAWLGAHKQIANRCQETYSTVEMVISATSWDNLFHLRCHRAAQPEFRVLACAMRDALEASTPERLETGQWHLPLVTSQDWLQSYKVIEPQLKRPLKDVYDESTMLLAKVSAGRCARVTLRSPDEDIDFTKDLERYSRLVGREDANDEPKHLSPLEHPAMALGRLEQYGPFTGWKQLRKFVEPRSTF